MTQAPLKTINGFSHLIQTLEGGALHADLSDDLHNVLTEMATYSAGPGNGRSKGEIVITLNFEQELETVRVRAKVKTKTQEIARRMSALFMTPGNKLSLEHPMQNSLPFGTVVQGGAPRPHESAAVIHSGQEHYDRATGEVHS